MKMLTAPHMDRCIGCHSCSLACARLVHKRISWETAGIRIKSSGGLSSGFIAIRCLACDPPPCSDSCPSNCLVPRRGGGIIVHKNRCIQCGKCIAACPVDGIVEDQAGDIFVCIHCGICVDFCPHDCLEMIDTSDRSMEEKI